MKRSLLTTFAVISALFSPASVVAACMPRPIAPGIFRNTPPQWGMDSGPIISGFLDLHDAQGAVAVKHGVDLSHHNTNVPYDRIKSCGATFAIIKVDDAFAAHRNSLVSRGIPIIPYFYLSVGTARTGDLKDQKSLFGDQQDPSPEAMKQIFRAAEQMAREKAAAFVPNYFNRVPPADRVIGIAGLHGQLIVVDVEETLRGRTTGAQRKNFGRFYGRMLSTWIAEVQTRIPNAVFVFYTFPAVYTDYLQFALPSDHAAIHGMPVWLARTRGDGSDLDLTESKGLQRLCLSASGGNRCILHQYSHRAVFGDGPAPSRGYPAHIDVDRLFDVMLVPDDTSVQFVRAREVPRKMSR